MTSSTRLRAVTMATLLAAVVLFGSTPASGADGVTVQATIDGRPARDASERDPIKLRPKEVASVEVEVTNAGSQAIDVRMVRLEGEVLALTFFAYDTSVFFSVAPGETTSRSFSLDLVGLGGQATGLIRGSVSILDGERRALASDGVVMDVRGSLWSVYGLFGLAIAVLTAVSLAGALIALARHDLPANRWRRGLRFLTPGLGIGLLVVFTLSALRVLLVRPGVWIPILLACGGGLFVVGYLTPAPDDDEDDETGAESGENLEADTHR
ncbi:MAG: hypothetical protein ACRD2W_10465 [Acidimicrobiales bacterium]